MKYSLNPSIAVPLVLCDSRALYRLDLNNIIEGFMELGIFDRFGTQPYILEQHDDSGNLVLEGLSNHSLLVIQQGRIPSGCLTIKGSMLTANGR